jgi:hypothetical protein
VWNAGIGQILDEEVTSMPDKRDMHQAKSHRSNKNKGQSTGQARGKARGQASVPGGSGATIAMEDTQAVPTVTGSAGGKKNKSRR